MPSALFEGAIGNWKKLSEERFHIAELKKPGKNASIKGRAFDSPLTH
jgi:hypothetical protein